MASAASANGDSGIQIERELQVDRTGADAAFAGERLAETVERLRKPCGGRGDEQVRALAGFDLVLQRAGDGMAVALGPLEVRLEEAQRQLGIAGVGRMPRVGERDAQRALVVLGYALVGGARLGAASGLIGEQRAMIAQVVLRPVRRLLGRIEDGQRLLGLVLRPIEPGARQRARQLADGVAVGWP